MIGPILRRAEAGRQPSYREVGLLLQAKGADHQALLETAGRIARRNKGEKAVHRGVIMLDSREPIHTFVNFAARAMAAGCTSVILKSESLIDAEWVAECIRSVKRTVPQHLALSLGERSYDEYALWRQAGVDQYVLPHETSNAELYGRLYPGHTPADRLTRYLWLRGLGYEMCGGLISSCLSRGASGVVDDMEILINLGMEAVAILPDGALSDLYTLVAVSRLCLPGADIWVRNDQPDVQSYALQVGANVLASRTFRNAIALPG